VKVFGIKGGKDVEKSVLYDRRRDMWSYGRSPSALWCRYNRPACRREACRDQGRCPASWPVQQAFACAARASRPSSEYIRRLAPFRRHISRQRGS